MRTFRASIFAASYVALAFSSIKHSAAQQNSNSNVTTKRLATFDNSAESTTFNWRTLNDPVMGGRSSSTFEIVDGVGLFKGTNEIVPQLQAPGFAYIGTTGATGGLYMFNNAVRFPDVSSYLDGDLVLNVSSSTPEYQGFKVAFLAQNVPASNVFTTGSFKSGFVVDGADQWQIIRIPFNDFSWDWSPYTGRCDTKDPDRMGLPGRQHECCANLLTTPDLCPTAEYLSTVTGLEVWAEGAEGDFDIKLGWIGVEEDTAVLRAAVSQTPDSAEAERVSDLMGTF